MAKQKKAIDKPVSGIALAAKWPVYEVLLSQGWEQQAVLITILIARRSPMSGKIAAGLLLVDLACLGIKSAQVKLFTNPAEYNTGLRAHAMHIQPMTAADLNLVAKIVMTGLDYAANLGFRPDPVFSQAEHLLSGADPASCTTPVPTGGPEGKPYFVAGPYDNASQIVAQLTRAVGAGNFHYMVQLQGGPMGMLDDED